MKDGELRTENSFYSELVVKLSGTNWNGRENLIN